MSKNGNNNFNHTQELNVTALFPEPLNSVILNALFENATDIYINAVPNGHVLLFRVDGILHKKTLIPRGEGRRLLNQIKAEANIGVIHLLAAAEGDIHFRESNTQRQIRVTMIPVGGGESAHLRFLSLPEQQWNMDTLGFSEQDKGTISDTLASLNGLVLVTGITGSGKTTTMYSIASLQDMQQLAAYSIEDPVEFDLPYAQQMEVNERQGLSMHEGLRTILRMNPDLIMIGEIRDKDSAIVATRAALSGRLVLATIHAQDAAGAVDALHYLGVPYYIIGGSLRLVIAQNLVRKLCDSCKQENELCGDERELFLKNEIEPPEKLFAAIGCEGCNGYGYKGQIGIFETARISPDIAQKIASGIHQEQLREYFRNNRVNTIIADALNKVKEGITSIQEIYRVTGLSFDAQK